MRSLLLKCAWKPATWADVPIKLVTDVEIEYLATLPLFRLQLATPYVDIGDVPNEFVLRMRDEEFDFYINRQEFDFCRYVLRVPQRPEIRTWNPKTGYL